MQHRNPLTVFLLSLITLGIYAFVWHVKTKNELNRLGAPHIPTAWLLIVPFANLYWIWKYSQGVEKVSGGKISTVLALILLLLLSIVGIAILQNEYNKLAPTPATDDNPAPTPAAAVTGAPAMPTPTSQPPVAPQTPENPDDDNQNPPQPPTSTPSNV